MVQPHYGSNREQAVDTMIELTRGSKLHRREHVRDSPLTRHVANIPNPTSLTRGHGLRGRGVNRSS